ncbi:ABC transporter ATP-binding protein [Limnohabitans sp. Rim11]|uniref:ABC transporter ATP-binding protein n=1 Tax=Limnohabitans sp. Rim11 TaxID=1100719 RepID=UPI000A508131|nr:ABC transporter ATP-binding protein [Limnohabitans sp. Rim11]
MLQIDSIEMSYGAIQAIRGVSFSVAKGEVVAIIGANGAGKSTLLKGVAGIEPLKQGRIIWNGIDISQVPAHERLRFGIALAPEGRGVFPDQSIRDNLLLGAYAIRNDKERVANLLEQEFQRFPRLKERSEQMAGTLSGGEQQMLAISRALMSQPQLLLLDEPSLGLAPLIMREIFQSIKSLREAGLTILLVEQMANQALKVADRAYVLETGSVKLGGSGKELADHPDVRAAYLGQTGSN